MVFDFSSLYGEQNELERFFKEVFKNNQLGARRMPYPQVNIAEDSASYIVDVCIPGADLSEIELIITARNLIIKGERTTPEGRYARQERVAGAFQRTLNLNVPVNRDQVSAKSQNGILRITLPKAENIKSRKIIVES